MAKYGSHVQTQTNILGGGVGGYAVILGGGMVIYFTRKQILIAHKLGLQFLRMFGEDGRMNVWKGGLMVE